MEPKKNLQVGLRNALVQQPVEEERVLIEGLHEPMEINPAWEDGPIEQIEVYKYFFINYVFPCIQKVVFIFGNDCDFYFCLVWYAWMAYLQTLIMVFWAMIGDVMYMEIEMDMDNCDGFFLLAGY